MQDERRERLEFGWRKEKELADLLAAREGVRILERNYRCKGGEIDLVLEETSGGGLTRAIELVLIEVKARRTAEALEALESVAKQRRLRRAAAAYLSQYHGLAQTVRWDAWLWEPESGWVRMRDLWLGR